MDWGDLVDKSEKDWSGVFEAQYEGTCSGCGDAIEAGDSVRFADGELVHQGCED